MSKLFQRVALAVLFSTSFCAHALTDAATTAQPAASKNFDTKPGMHFLFDLGLTFGGDTIITAVYTDGSSKDLKAGGLLQLGIGGLYQFESTPMALAVSANYHVNNVTATNGDMSFNRYPVEVLAYYTGVNRFRFGGGARIVNSPEASITINGATTKYSFDNTVGYVAELGYRMAPYSWVNFRYVSEKYQGKERTNSNGSITSLAGSKTLDGSHFGVNFVFEY